MHRQHDQAFIHPISLGNVVCKCTIMKPQNESARLLLAAFPPSCPLRAGARQTNKQTRGEAREQPRPAGMLGVGMLGVGMLGAGMLGTGSSRSAPWFPAPGGSSCMGVQVMGAPRELCRSVLALAQHPRRVSNAPVGLRKG